MSLSGERYGHDDSLGCVKPTNLTSIDNFPPDLRRAKLRAL